MRRAWEWFNRLGNAMSALYYLGLVSLWIVNSARLGHWLGVREFIQLLGRLMDHLGH
jgi:hypothetical protein